MPSPTTAARPAAYVSASGVKLPGFSILGEHDATPERLAHANDNDVTDDGARRIIEGFERMASKAGLDPNPAINYALRAAGRRYQTDHHFAGLNPLGAMDYARPIVDGGGQQLMSESMARRRDSFRRARTSIAARFRPVVDAVVIDGTPFPDIARAIGRSGSRGEGIVWERMNLGLRQLAAYYAVLDRDAVLADPADRPGR